MRHLIALVLNAAADHINQGGVPTIKERKAEAKAGILEGVESLIARGGAYLDARTDCLRADQELMKAETENRKASSQGLAQMADVIKPLLTELISNYLGMKGKDLYEDALSAYPQRPVGVVSISEYLDFLRKNPGFRDEIAWTGGPSARLEDVARELAYEGYDLRLETSARKGSVLIVNVVKGGCGGPAKDLNEVPPQAEKPEEIPTVEALPTHDEDGKKLSQDVLMDRYVRESHGRLRVNGGRSFAYVGTALAPVFAHLLSCDFECHWKLNTQEDGTLVKGEEDRLTIVSAPVKDQALSEGAALFYTSGSQAADDYGAFLSDQWGPAKSPVYVFFGGPGHALDRVSGALNARGYRCEFSIEDGGGRHELAVYLLPPAVEAKLAELPKNQVG